MMTKKFTKGRADTLFELIEMLQELAEFGDYELVSEDSGYGWTPVSLLPEIVPFKIGQLSKGPVENPDLLPQTQITYKVTI